MLVVGEVVVYGLVKLEFMPSINVPELLIQVGHARTALKYEAVEHVPTDTPYFNLF